MSVEQFVSQWYDNLIEMNFFKEEDIDEAFGTKAFFEIATEVCSMNDLLYDDPNPTEKQFGEILQEVVIYSTALSLKEKGLVELDEERNMTVTEEGYNYFMNLNDFGNINFN
tara:strand:+ start:462 stop:797 length:336 start_codon:yes stop_codon:yes gene_type:complete